MKMIAFVVLALLLAVAGSAGAQTFEHLSIDVRGNTIGAKGGEQPNAGMSTGPIVIGKTTNAGFAKMPDMCGFGVAARLLPGAISGWTAEVTPVRVDGDAVTFRLRWVRSRDENRDSSSPSGDVELTLRPGESLPIDMVPLSASVKMPYENCGVRATSLRVEVNYWPHAQNDRSLVATELWLVERAPDGTERSQALSLRGRLNEKTPFYFDTLVDGGTALDLYGGVTVTSVGDSLTVHLETRSRVTESGRSSTVLRDGRMMRAREVESEIEVKPGEVVAVELPRLSENETGAFANRTFSIRVRTRQIR
jgi:hypothetical protein